MLDIKLCINNLHVLVGMALNKDTLKSAGIEKVGFFMKSATSQFKQDGDEIYWIKNPSVMCFDNFDTVVQGGGAHLPWSTPAEMICGTSVFLYFNKDRLRLVITQVIASGFWARRFNERFRELTFEAFGKPDDGALDLMVAEWSDGDCYIRSAISGENTFLFWGNHD
jgi:hypothetical protein